ncbi:hypothetical protein HanRHA438_Chr06g0269491 [Helianthus annuus]|nr:hypothetical protein HanRHA438_Chr06g0269491 [Helianthus annuus]
MGDTKSNNRSGWALPSKACRTSGFSQLDVSFVRYVFLNMTSVLKKKCCF